MNNDICCQKYSKISPCNNMIRHGKLEILLMGCNKMEGGADMKGMSGHDSRYVNIM